MSVLLIFQISNGLNKMSLNPDFSERAESGRIEIQLECFEASIEVLRRNRSGAELLASSLRHPLQEIEEKGKKREEHLPKPAMRCRA
jgi:hypothetical protein